MKKIKQKLLLLICLSVFSALIGCSNQNVDNTAEVKELKKQIEELKAENEQLKNDSVSTMSVDNDTSAKNDDSIVIALNEVITIESICEISVKKFEFANKIEPPNVATGSFYNYYEIKDAGNTYLDLVIDYKNLESSDKLSDTACSVKIKYDDKYEYDSFSAIEKSGGSDFTYTNITGIAPLTLGTLHYVSQVPLEVKDSDKSVVAYITVANKEYSLKIK